MAPHTDYFENIYTREFEPWNYTGRAAEALRIQHIAKTANGLCPENGSVLDVGCSLGQITVQLSDKNKVIGIDISEKAIERAKKLYPLRHITWMVRDSQSLQFENLKFNLILLCDGLFGWRLDEKEKIETIEQSYQSLEKGGHALFTDYMKPREFSYFIHLIQRHAPWDKVQVHYFNDRLWFQFECWFKSVKQFRIVRKILSSVIIAQYLCFISKFLGIYGSRHIMVVAKKVFVVGLIS